MSSLASDINQTVSLSSMSTITCRLVVTGTRTNLQFTRLRAVFGMLDGTRCLPKRHAYADVVDGQIESHDVFDRNRVVRLLLLAASARWPTACSYGRPAAPTKSSSSLLSLSVSSITSQSQKIRSPMIESTILECQPVARQAHALMQRLTTLTLPSIEAAGTTRRAI